MKITGVLKERWGCEIAVKGADVVLVCLAPIMNVTVYWAPELSLLNAPAHFAVRYTGVQSHYGTMDSLKAEMAKLNC